MRVALVHGLGGTAATMAPLADRLAQRGHECTCVLLPGHGTTAADLRHVTWQHWLEAVPDADVLIGQSMGGSLCLAAAAAGRPHLRGVVAINAPAPDPDAVDGLEWRLSRGHDWVDGPALAEGEVGYTSFPLTAVLAMASGVLATDLAAVRVPVLLANGAGDDVVDPASAGALAASLSGPVTRLVLPRTGHVATFGPDLADLAAAVLTFLTALDRTGTPDTPEVT